MEYFELDFFGLIRKLPLTHISRDKRIANFNILGDIEFTEVAGKELEKKLTAKNIKPDCFVGPEVKVVPFVHHMAKRYRHKRYVILRKSVKGYMTDPTIEYPFPAAPKHIKKMVLGGLDKAYLQGKRVVLLDDVVSTGATMEMLSRLMRKIGVAVIARCAIFKQGNISLSDFFYLAQLPIFDTEKISK